MVGKKIGFSTLIKEKLGRSVTSLWCFSHRNEKIYEHAMKKFPIFGEINKELGALHAFYSR